MDKQSIKKFIPKPIWRKLRKRQILRDHKRIGAIFDNYIDEYYSSGACLFEGKPKQDLKGEKIIWQYWAQGFDGELPEVVTACLSSVDRYKGEWEIIRLSDETIAEYVDIPDFVWAKRGNGFSITAFSNVLRLALLYLYGGVWIDATVLLTAPIPERYSHYGFFMFQRDQNEKNKRYWEDSYAYYFGWEKDFKVRVLTSIAFGKTGDAFLKDYLNCLLYVWKKNDSYPFYFSFQILFNQLVLKGHKPNCPIESDCPPHYLMQIINDKFSFISKKQIHRDYWAHKLTYKDIDNERFDMVLSQIAELQ